MKVVVPNQTKEPQAGGVIPKPRAFTSGARDLGRITTAVRKQTGTTVGIQVLPSRDP